MRYKLHSSFVDEVLTFYQEGHGVKETAEKFQVTVHQVNNWVKRRGVSNGRVWHKVSNGNRAKEKSLKVQERLNERGQVLFGEWHGSNYKYSVLDLKTGIVREVSGKSIARRRKRNRGSRIQGRIDNKGIDLKKLIERDGPCCYICGKTTTFEDKTWGNWGPDHPSIDHVVPLSKQGRHSWENVRVCCGMCNVTKGVSQNG